MMWARKKDFIAIFLPLFLALLIYLFFRGNSNLLFIKLLSFLKIPHFQFEKTSINLFLVYAMPDGLWLFAMLNFIKSIWAKKNAHERMIWYAIAIFFALLFEYGQKFGFVQGTFDVFDLWAYFFSFLTFIFLNMKRFKTSFFSFWGIVFFAILAFGSAEPTYVKKTNAPNTEVRTEPKQESLGWVEGENHASGWATIPLSEKISYNLAWEDITGLISRKFEFDMLTKETGYIRTKWKNMRSTNGIAENNYRVRVTVKISEMRKKVEINTEAERLVNGLWYKGTDTGVLADLKKDVAGMVGS